MPKITDSYIMSEVSLDAVQMLLNQVEINLKEVGNFLEGKSTLKVLNIGESINQCVRDVHHIKDILNEERGDS